MYKRQELNRPGAAVEVDRPRTGGQGGGGILSEALGRDRDVAVRSRSVDAVGTIVEQEGIGAVVIGDGAGVCLLYTSRCV